MKSNIFIQNSLQDLEKLLIGAEREISRLQSENMELRRELYRQKSGNIFKRLIRVLSNPAPLSLPETPEQEINIRKTA